jgi:hypothetical protein
MTNYEKIIAATTDEPASALEIGKRCELSRKESRQALERGVTLGTIDRYRRPGSSDVKYALSAVVTKEPETFVPKVTPANLIAPPLQRPELNPKHIPSVAGPRQPKVTDQSSDIALLNSEAETKETAYCLECTQLANKLSECEEDYEALAKVAGEVTEEIDHLRHDLKNAQCAVKMAEETIAALKAEIESLRAVKANGSDKILFGAIDSASIKHFACESLEDAAKMADGEGDTIIEFRPVAQMRNVLTMVPIGE